MGILLRVLVPTDVAVLALKVDEKAHTPLSLAFFLDDVIPDQSLFQSSGSVRVFSGSYMRESFTNDIKNTYTTTNNVTYNLKQISDVYVSSNLYFMLAKWRDLPPNFPSPRPHPNGLLLARHHCPSCQQIVIDWCDWRQHGESQRLEEFSLQNLWHQQKQER